MRRKVYSIQRCRPENCSTVTSKEMPNLRGVVPEEKLQWKYHRIPAIFFPRGLESGTCVDFLQPASGFRVFVAEVTAHAGGLQSNGRSDA